MNFEGAKNFILNKLRKELDPKLTYHSVWHSLDVLESVQNLAKSEKLGEEETLILKTAAVFHDSGMLITYIGHEEASLKIVREILPSYSFPQEIIESICKMIITTKLPQSARSLEEKILCDADLDYLGRPDYFMIAHQLKYEWNILKIHPTTLLEWYEIQDSFLSGHTYFTKSAISMRQEGKMRNLAEIRELMNGEK